MHAPLNPRMAFLAAATIASLFSSTILHSQVFTDLRSTGLFSIFGAASTPGGAAVFGGGFNDVVRWTKSDGVVHLDTPQMSPYPFKPEHVSGDGSVIVGRGSGSGENLFRPSAYRWTVGDGVQELITNIRNDHLTTPTRVSANGSAVAGFGPIAGYRWTENTGLTTIGARLDGSEDVGPNNPLFVPKDLSADGSVLVGINKTDPSAFAFGPGVASRWTAATGLETLGTLFNNGAEEHSVATGVSADGSIAVGNAFTPFDSEAFRWTADTGMTGLGFLPGGSTSFALAISNDGSIIVGGGNSAQNQNGTDPFLWTPGSGMQRLVDVLTNQYGVGSQIAGWQLGPISALSRDGRFIVGNGTGPDGRGGPWLVDLGVSPIPEPATYGLVGAVGLLVLVLVRRFRIRI